MCSTTLNLMTSSTVSTSVLNIFKKSYNKHNLIVSIKEPGKKGRIPCENDEVSEETVGWMKSLRKLPI